MSVCCFLRRLKAVGNWFLHSFLSLSELLLSPPATFQVTPHLKTMCMLYDKLDADPVVTCHTHHPSWPSHRGMPLKVTHLCGILDVVWFSVIKERQCQEGTLQHYCDFCVKFLIIFTSYIFLLFLVPRPGWHSWKTYHNREVSYWYR